jgi:hypothetical protein
MTPPALGAGDTSGLVRRNAVMAVERGGPPRTRKSSLTLAAVKPWGSWARYRHTRDQRRVYGISSGPMRLEAEAGQDRGIG